MSQPSIRKNFIFRALYELLVLITPFITIPYIARVLGSDSEGIRSYTGSVMAFFTVTKPGSLRMPNMPASFASDFAYAASSRAS